MDILQHLKDYKMKRFFSNNCAWTKECKEEYKAINALIATLSPEPIKLVYEYDATIDRIVANPAPEQV